MKSLPCGLGGIALVLLTLPSPASAQYMYLDSNRDGVHTAADVLHEVGPTVVDIWLDTGHNRDGSVPVCTYPSEQITMFSYQVTVRASGGTVSYSPYTNRMAEMYQLISGIADDTRFTMPAFAKTPPGTSFPPGLYLLGTFTVSVGSGTPSIQIDAGTDVNGLTDGTAFGSNCPASAFGNTMALGFDWFDVDGLPYVPGGGPNQAPALAPVADMTVFAGENAAQTITANDADGQSLTFSKSSGPAFMFVATADAGTGTARGEIRLAPFTSDVGTGTGIVSVTDGAASGQATFQIAVSAGANHQPYMAPIARLTVMAGLVGKRFLSAGDPDGGAVHIAKTSGPGYVRVRELAVGTGGTSAILTASPTLCDVGPATAIVTVTDGVGQEERGVELSVIPPSAPPDSALTQYLSPNGRTATGIALGDLNRDGNLDVVAALEGMAEILVYMGHGDGGLAPPVSYPVAGWPLSLVTADLNRDGTLDVAAPNSFGVGVSVLLGRGDGTFLPQVSYETGHGPQGIAAADMNHDGNMDLVTCNHESGTVSVLLGAGDGTFAARRDSRLGPSATTLVVQDFNLDGRPDVVASHAAPGGASQALSMLPGIGDGTFGEPVPGPTSGYALSIASADWNGDGIPDVALSNFSPGKVLVFDGRGDGTFEPPKMVAQLGLAWGIAAGDLNGDGNMDLAATDSDQNRVAILFGNGAGGFASPVFLAGLGVSGYVALGDLNSDGRPDVIAGDIAVVLNRFAPGIPPVEARAFVLGGNRTVPAGAGTGNLCVRVEPVDRSYTNDQVDLASFTLRSEGTGSVSEIHSVATRRNVDGDTDGNGVSEVAAFFSRSDLATLFDKLHGRTTAPAQLTGSLTDARAFCTDVTLNVVGTGGPRQTAAFAPNPLNPQSKLTFATAREGPARALLFDIQGRLIRTLLDTPRLAAGPHDYSFDGKDDRGRSLSSGVYFYRVRSVEGVFDGQIVILK